MGIWALDVGITEDANETVVWKGREGGATTRKSNISAARETKGTWTDRRREWPTPPDACIVRHTKMSCIVIQIDSFVRFWFDAGLKVQQCQITDMQVPTKEKCIWKRKYVCTSNVIFFEDKISQTVCPFCVFPSLTLNSPWKQSIDKRVHIKFQSSGGQPSMWHTHPPTHPNINPA